MIDHERVAATLALIFGFVCFLASGCENKKPVEPESGLEHTLTVAIEEGVEGFPQTGTYFYAHGHSVNYGYRALPDFYDLAVTLNGQTIPEEGAFIMDKDYDLQAASNRRIIWRFSTPHSVYYASPAIGDDGTIYFGTGLFTLAQGWSSGILYALNPDGTLKWSRTIGEALFSPAIGMNGNIYIIDRTYTVRAFSPDGTLLWTFNDYTFPGFVKRDMGQRTPAIGNDGTVYVGADGLYALDALSGIKIWHVPRQSNPMKECIASPVIARDGVIYVVIGQDSLYAVRTDGSVQWTFGFAHPHELSFADPSIAPDGTIYVPSESYAAGAHVYAINKDGTLKWKYRVDDDRSVRASITIGPDGTLYLTTKAGGTDRNARLIALSPSGQKLWHYVIEGRHETGDDSYSTPSIGADGMIYFGAETGFLYALQPDGTLAWKHEVASGINWSSPAILSDGTLLIGGMGCGEDYTGQFSAVITGSHGYAASSWPRFRRDNKNSGRFGY